MDAEARKQYFQLIVLLNQNNKLINEKTLLEFYCEDKKVFAQLIGGAKIQLCKYNKNNYWVAAEFTKLYELETMVAVYLKTRPPNMPLNDFIHSKLFPKI